MWSLALIIGIPSVCILGIVIFIECYCKSRSSRDAHLNPYSADVKQQPPVVAWTNAKQVQPAPKVAEESDLENGWNKTAQRKGPNGQPKTCWGPGGSPRSPGGVQSEESTISPKERWPSNSTSGSDLRATGNHSYDLEDTLNSSEAMILQYMSEMKGQKMAQGTPIVHIRSEGSSAKSSPRPRLGSSSPRSPGAAPVPAWPKLRLKSEDCRESKGSFDTDGVRSAPAGLFRKEPLAHDPDSSLTLQSFRCPPPSDYPQIKQYHSERSSSKNSADVDKSRSLLGFKKPMKPSPQIKQPSPPDLCEIPSLPANYGGENTFLAAMKPLR